MSRSQKNRPRLKWVVAFAVIILVLNAICIIPATIGKKFSNFLAYDLNKNEKETSSNTAKSGAFLLKDNNERKVLDDMGDLDKNERELLLQKETKETSPNTAKSGAFLLKDNNERKVLDDMGKSILVTGAAGFIGMHTALELKNKGVHVVALDNMNDYYSIQLKEERVEMLKEAGVEFIKGNACDETLLGNVIRDHKIDRVVHLAAQAGVRFSLKSPHSYTTNNVDCFVSVLEEFFKAGLQNKPIVYASSSSVYGFNHDAPFTEDVSDVDHPASLYAATKRADELIAHTYNHLYNVSSVGLRLFTVYGPYGRPDMSPMIFAHKITNNETLKLTNFGNSVRDFTYISDIVEGIIAALNLDTNRSDLFNLGGNNPIKLTYFVKLLEEGLQKEATKELVPIQEGDVPLTYANVTKAGIFLGWSPKIPIEVGVQHFLNWYTNHSASKFMYSPKKEVCVITASFAKEANSMDTVFDVSAYKKIDENLAFYYFSNLDLDWSKKGWDNVQLADLRYRRMITKSRWPKFMAWQHPTIANNCKTVFYLDASSRPKDKSDFVELLHDLKAKVLSSEVGFAIPLRRGHGLGFRLGSNIPTEFSCD